MATRFYLGYSAASAAGAGFAVSSEWETPGSYSAIARRTKRAQAFSQLGIARVGSGLQDVLVERIITERLSGNQTITGTFGGVVRMAESNAAADMRVQCVVRVLAPDGTVRGTLIAADTGALSSEFTTTATNRLVPRGGAAAVTSVAALDGDRIVIEIGARSHFTGSTAYVASAVLGDASATDAAVNEVDTTANNGWVEFSQDLVFRAQAVVGTVHAEVLIVSSGRGRVGAVNAEVLVKAGGRRFGWGRKLSGDPVTMLRGARLTAAVSSSVNALLPVGSVLGDEAIIFAGHGFTPNVITGATDLDVQSGSNWNGRTYRKVLDATDITNGYIAVGFSGSFNGVVGIVTLKGAAPAGIREDKLARASAGAASVVVTSTVTPLARDLVIYFGSNRAASDNTVSRGTVLATLNAANGSGVLSVETLVTNPGGTISATYGHPVAGSGYYDGHVIVQGA